MISIAIPYHDTPQTAFYLSRLLKSLDEQTYRDFEVVLTKEGAFARNHNAAIMKAKGELIQMMQMDDYFAHPDALHNIVLGLQDSIWQISACLHDHHGQIGNYHEPQWTDDIYTGNNRLGSVSTLSFRTENQLLMEEPLTWLVDCDHYYRFYLKYGKPKICTVANVVITERPDRLTHTLSSDIKNNEVQYLIRKYAK
jgi:hypothetical protein